MLRSSVGEKSILTKLITLILAAALLMPTAAFALEDTDIDSSEGAIQEIESTEIVDGQEEGSDVEPTEQGTLSNLIIEENPTGTVEIDWDSYSGAAYYEVSSPAINGGEAVRTSSCCQTFSGLKHGADYDFIIVDADITFDEDKAALFNIADKVIVVVKQTLASVLATNILVSNINGASADKYVFICNDFDKEEDNALISPNVALKFSVSDYIDHFNHYANMKPDDLSKESSIQKAAFLII